MEVGASCIWAPGGLLPPGVAERSRVRMQVGCWGWHVREGAGGGPSGSSGRCPMPPGAPPGLTQMPAGAAGPAGPLFLCDGQAPDVGPPGCRRLRGA